MTAGLKKTGKKLEGAYKSARSAIRSKTESSHGRAIGLHADKNLGDAAKKAGLGGAYKVAKRAAQSEFSGNKKVRVAAKADLRRFARTGTTAGGGSAEGK